MTLLKGLKILDLSRILAGPWATQYLADLGAEVIKIESLSGDDTRKWGPPWVIEGEEAAYYTAANRGKKSISVDLKQAEGRALIQDLAQHCDVVVENFKVGGAAQFGLDYASLSKLNDQLIYCSITGFGQTGPNAGRAGYDAMIQGAAGLMSITGNADDTAGAGPAKVGVAVTDLMAGMYAVSSILAALLEREQSGKGQAIDVALFDTQVAWLANQAANYLVGGIVPNREGTAHPNIAPYQAVEAADGYFMLAVGNDRQFKELARICGHPEWATDERFSSNANRVRHRKLLIKLIECETVQRPQLEWLKACELCAVPSGPISRLDDVFKSPQVIQRALILSQHREDGHEIKTVSHPVKFSRSHVSEELAPPALAQHTDLILAQLDYDEERIERLRKGGVIR